MKEVKILDKTFEVMIDEAKITARINSISAQITKEYEGKNPVFLGVLNGAFLFLADLFKGIHTPSEISFIRVSSYSGTKSTGEMKNVFGLKENISNRHVIIVEDIVDTGETMKYLFDELKKQNPASLKLATLLFKPAALKNPVTPDYVGFEIDPDFVVGYGLDYNGYGRNLTDIYVLKP
jgi:hypoxanthine phosphoribosyltransferase